MRTAKELIVKRVFIFCIALWATILVAGVADNVRHWVWLKEDGIEVETPPVRYFRYDNPELVYSGTWSYVSMVDRPKGPAEQVYGRAPSDPGPADLQAIKALYLASREVNDHAVKLRQFHDRQPESVMIGNERERWRPADDTRAYYNELAELGARARAALDKTDRFHYGPDTLDAFAGLIRDLKQVSDDIDACLDRQVRKLPPVVFVTGAVLGSVAVPVYISMGNPLGKRWGCDLRIWDPANPQAPAKVIFHDDKAMILDMNLSYDARTVFFSMRTDHDKYWQIYEIGIDGQGLKQITRGYARLHQPVGRQVFQIAERDYEDRSICERDDNGKIMGTCLCRGVDMLFHQRLKPMLSKET